MVNTTLLLLVQDNLEGLGAVLLGANALADDLNGVDQVSEDVVVDGGQSAGTGTLLGLVGAGVDGALRAGQNAALSNEEDVAVRELLLQLAGQAVKRIAYVSPTAYLGSAGESEMCRCSESAWSVLPLLDLVEALQEGNGDEDDDGLLAVADLDLITRVSC